MFWQTRRYDTLGFSYRIQFQNSCAAGLGFYQDPSYKAPVSLLWAYTFPNETYTESPRTWQDNLALFIRDQKQGEKKQQKKASCLHPRHLNMAVLGHCPKDGHMPRELWAMRVRYRRAELSQIYISLIPALKQGDVEVPLGTTRSEGVEQKSASIYFKEQERFLGGTPRLKSI